LKALFRLRIPGDHVIQDAAAALLLVLDQYKSLENPGVSGLDNPDFLKALENGIYNSINILILFFFN
jgi:hypothetical protein